MCDNPSAWVTYFGYGSLVNRDTRPPAEQAVNATLKGWQRVWNHRVVTADSNRKSTSLNIQPATGSIDGVLVRVPFTELPALDEREYGYERLTLAPSDFVLPADLDTGDIHVYRSLRVNQREADNEHPIMQTYVDCVMAGYERRFGKEGLLQWLHTTIGWERPIFNDRCAPRYPRSVSLPAHQLRQFDRLLSEIRTQH